MVGAGVGEGGVRPVKSVDPAAGGGSGGGRTLAGSTAAVVLILPCKFDPVLEPTVAVGRALDLLCVGVVSSAAATEGVVGGTCDWDKGRSVPPAVMSAEGATHQASMVELSTAARRSL